MRWRFTNWTHHCCAESPNRQGAHAPVDADQQRRSLTAHPLLGPVIDGCLMQQPRSRPTSPAAFALLNTVAAAPGFNASHAPGTEAAADAIGGGWTEAAQHKRSGIWSTV